MRLSHSSKETYMTCPKKWELHYQDKLRSTRISSPLFFGSAIDDALNILLLAKKKAPTESEKLLMKSTPEEAFRVAFENVRIAGEMVEIPKSNRVQYFKKDCDLSLLDASDILKIVNFGKELDFQLETFANITDFVAECQELAKKTLEENSQRVYNYICWLALYRKGLRLIEGYNEIIMPQIEEVFEIQKEIKVEDEEDTFVGYIDLICSFVSNPGIRYICDNKTSSRAYKEDSVRTSEQLAAYSEHESIRNCAYIVLEKDIRKRVPQVRCNIIKDTMPEKMIDETFDKITHVFEEIQEKKFDKDFDACYQYGQKCSYWDYCRTGSLKDLKYTGQEKKNDKSNKQNEEPTS